MCERGGERKEEAGWEGVESKQRQYVINIKAVGRDVGGDREQLLGFNKTNAPIYAKRVK